MDAGTLGTRLCRTKASQGHQENTAFSSFPPASPWLEPSLLLVLPVGPACKFCVDVIVVLVGANV